MIHVEHLVLEFVAVHGFNDKPGVMSHCVGSPTVHPFVRLAINSGDSQGLCFQMARSLVDATSPEVRAHIEVRCLVVLNPLES
jgi:hypothetical protein